MHPKPNGIAHGDRLSDQQIIALCGSKHPEGDEKEVEAAIQRVLARIRLARGDRVV